MNGWEAVRDPRDHRRVVYWRLRRDGRYVGAVSRKGSLWHAIAYPPDGPDVKRNRDLGNHETRRRAERAVEGARKLGEVS